MAFDARHRFEDIFNIAVSPVFALHRGDRRNVAGSKSLDIWKEDTEEDDKQEQVGLHGQGHGFHQELGK